MKNYLRILTLLLCVVLFTFAFASCDKNGKRGDATTAHSTQPSTESQTTAKNWEPVVREISGYAAQNRSLKFELDNFTGPERIAQNKKYIEGPDAIDNVTASIDKMVYKRNHAAMDLFGVSVEYVYWDDAWDKQSTNIISVVQGNAADAPDLFVNMVFDLNIALKTQGVFKDVLTIPGNFFDFNTKGWMKDWMMSYSFTGDRAYVLGGDYFIDILRAMGVLPFNVDLMDANADKLASAILGEGETLGAGEELSTAFFDLVDKGEWTWDVLGKLCAAIWVDENGDGADSITDTLGFVTDSYTGMPSALILFSTGETLTTTQYDETRGRNWITINQDSIALGKIFDAVKGVVDGSGSFVTNDATSKGSTIDQPGIAYHQIKFSENTLLFCGPQLLGALEGDAFQQMAALYSVVPLPKVDESKEYNTVIHNTADCGAINVKINPQKARTISAFLQYCVENSGDIRNEFLQIVMKYKNTVYNQGTDRMLNLIYSRMINARDKGIEDAAERTSGERYHGVMKDNGFTWGSSDIVSWFESVKKSKQDKIDEVLNQWYTLPGGTGSTGTAE